MGSSLTWCWMTTPGNYCSMWVFVEQYSVRPWLGSLDPDDAREEWAEMLGEDPDNYIITDADNRDYCEERSSWDHRKMWPPRP